MSYSILETFPAPPPGRDYLYQPFTQEEWNSSNFASAQELQWFKDARYGMFIHFGLSTYINRDLSWGVCHTRKAPDFGNGPIADEEWTSWANRFCFEEFDAKRWIEIARRSGFKYVVVVTKHHDGFHMWDTDESEFKVTNTPFGRDFVREIVNACHEQDMPIGFYYSQRDWSHPDYMPVDPKKIEPQTENNWTLKPEFDSPIGDNHWKYLEYQEKAVRELCTRYGKIDLFWWDALWWGGMFTAEMWDAERINRMIRDLQPGITINNRCSIPGDFDTPEKRLGAFQNWRPWESCVCLSETWSYSGTKIKPLKDLVAMLTMTVCGGGNLLVSWGPKWEGEFDTAEVSALESMGEWITRHQDAIFSTQAGPWKPGTWGGAVYRGSTIYLHIIRVIKEQLSLPEIPDCKVLAASFYKSDTSIEFRQEGGNLVMDIPANIQTEPSTIIELQIDKAAETIEPLDSCEVSPFMDICAYGYEYDGEFSIAASSNKDKQSSAQQYLPLQTEVEISPWIVLDLKTIVSLTAIDLVLDQCSDPQDIHLHTSSDGESWKDWGKVNSEHVQMEVTTYEAGAWVPGHDTRFVKLISNAKQANSIHLQKFGCFSRS